uniref:PABC domain-containing protein n=1 Tax=Haptolina ericina TaxID=156174 RepID=A0A7S3B0P6_9EUKA|mmetsp:Transcript_41576/g.93955  ORF Transcript_41576/g.93955 Transcript_41576/m.93955 type:complete len:207 (+) Transcript_41576:36-656(+)
MGKNNRREPKSAHNQPGRKDGPVPVKKVPSLRGGHNLPLHAGFTKAPSPRSLPRPPLRWTASAAAKAATSAPPPETATVPAVVLQNSGSVLRQLQGNLLHTLLAPHHPLLAGKITGMLLELPPDEVATLLSDERARAESVAEAMQVLREAGDPRALGHVPSAAQPLQLSVEVGTAMDWTGTGAEPMRMSPRVSSNPYASNNILQLS